jgi:lipopolysaccharide export system permease protein
VETHISEDFRSPGGQRVKLLDRYIMISYAKGMIPVLLLLLALFSFVALASELEQVGKGTYSQIDAFLVVLFTTPRRMVDLLPVTALMGGLMGLGAMANHHELIAARAAGMSKARMARPVLATALVTAVLVVLMQSLLVPVSEREATQLRSRSLENTALGLSGKMEFWTWSGQNIVHVDDVRYNRILTNVEIYRVNDDGQLTELIEAAGATIAGDDTWLLEDVRRTRLTGMAAQEERIPSIEFAGLLSESQTNILILPVEVLSPSDLVQNIRHLRRNGLDTHFFRVIFWQQFAIVLAVIAMGLLSLPLLVGSTRSISASQRILAGGMVGIGFYLLQQLTGHLAGLFNLLPWLTILAPVLVLLIISVAAQYWRPPVRKTPTQLNPPAGF